MYGKWQEEIGFKVADSTGFLLFRRDPGASYDPTEILGYFTPGSTNPLSVKYSSKIKSEQASEEISSEALGSIDIDEES